MPTITIGGVEFPLATWAVSALSVVAIAFASFYGYRYFYPVEPELVSTQQANHLLRLENQEYNRHIMETPQSTLADNAQFLRVSAFEDGCVVVTRRFAGATNTRLLVDPSRVDIEHGDAGDIAWATPGVAVLSADQQPPTNCWNPHPGAFQWVYGKKINACLVPVIRTFYDGCVHMQLHNPCANTWDSNRDGSPKVTWTKCVH